MDIILIVLHLVMHAVPDNCQAACMHAHLRVLLQHVVLAGHMCILAGIMQCILTTACSSAVLYFSFAPAAPSTVKPKLRLSWAGSGIYFW